MRHHRVWARVKVNTFKSSTRRLVLETDVGAAENAAAAAWGRISLGGGGVSAAGTYFLATWSLYHWLTSYKLMYTLYAKINFKIEWRFERSTIYTLFSIKQIFGYDNGTADVTKCRSKFFCNTRRPNVKTWRLAELNYPSRFIHFLNFLGKNLTIGAPIKIYRRRVEFIGGGAHVC